ncbi:carboxymuconolactone decarboxylase family protein [Leucobacter massiliensis]|uniref:Alkylhydroperoxidase n=1 Tax=Leucobacter massiliensis TaxID=1686285 RepID=A0A2S9QQN3_9MICO|nr:carboxymuconolactone decarboxylase family protein [Leucobacter massiliensis]PRI11903.1 alkylhydroperoxidase [Leucobacter massiliensis]
MTRINVGKQHPDVYEQLATLSGAAEGAAFDAGLDRKLIELVKLRVSQINGCAFCCRLHSRAALRAGETADRLAVLPAWRESQYFSAEEVAALSIAEDVARLSHSVCDEDSEDALTAEKVSAVTWVATVMCAWNRVAIRSGYQVSP